MLSMLLRDGYIRRVPDPRGDRGIQMFISPTRLSVLGQATPLLAELSDELLAGIDARRLTDFFELADLIADRAKSYGCVETS